MPFCKADPLFYGCEIKGESNKMRNGTISGRIVGWLPVVGFMTKNGGWFNQAGSLVCYIHVTGTHLVLLLSVFCLLAPFHSVKIIHFRWACVLAARNNLFVCWIHTLQCCEISGNKEEFLRDTKPGAGPRNSVLAKEVKMLYIFLLREKSLLQIVSMQDTDFYMDQGYFFLCKYSTT